ncbi:hypothetical protein IE81DRAFT_345648 [Ceraceosorus guamensis]|uniref:PEBP-like protein n=1 Tax=Ceraceosorus guamensis TaxID=1522189 RepID=A0A316W3G3_9BASI|nr:hypothetical protein IE81DRAFT_345648 [Ceraceosorus guamensis]PWN44416.1 hypothetical protein IE81DRAFT_345648 [Ceraceosorus guamensis]
MKLDQFAIAITAALLMLSSSAVASPLDTSKLTVRQAKHEQCLANNAQNRAHQLKQMRDSGLIPEALPEFDPKTVITQSFSGRFYETGDGVNPLTQTLFAPAVYFPPARGADRDTKYTLIINDIDAPPPLGIPSFLHWFRRGLSASCGRPASQSGEDVRFYFPATPPPNLSNPAGHRYTVSVFREPASGYNPSQLEYLLKLVSFDVRDFIQRTGAELVAASYYTAAIPAEDGLLSPVLPKLGGVL